MVTRYGIEVRGYFDNGRKAQVDPDHCVRLNYEAYFFADLAAVDRFLADPLRFCGMLTDPVSKRRFRPLPDAPGAMHEGIDYFFENQANRDMFVRMPDSFRLPGYKMQGRAEQGESSPNEEAAAKGGAGASEKEG